MPASLRNRERLRRQMLSMTGGMPRVRATTETLFRRRMGWLRVPLGILFTLGGVFSILPVLGLWMLPVGLILLAFDLPGLRAVVTAWLIRGRRWLRNRRARRRHA